MKWYDYGPCHISNISCPMYSCGTNCCSQYILGTCSGTQSTVKPTLVSLRSPIKGYLFGTKKVIKSWTANLSCGGILPHQIHLLLITLNQPNMN